MANEDGSITIEFTVPGNYGICYVSAALKVGMAELSRSRDFIELAENNTAARFMGEAEECLAVLFEVINQASAQVFNQSSPQASGSDTVSSIAEFPAGFAVPPGEGNPLEDDED